MRYSIRKPKRGRGHRADDWLMTYADMITLLLCFFAIFLSVSVPKEQQMKEAEKSVREKFAKDADIREVFIKPIIENEKKSRDQNIYDNLPSIVAFYQDRKDVNVKKDGDRITTIEMDSATSFASGSATLSTEGVAILDDLKARLTGPEFENYTITVEGHTDDAPIKTLQFPSNWELSTARAAAVVRYMIEHGVQPGRLRAAGYADVFPKVPNRDEAGNPLPENRAKNRRVVIKLEKIEKGAEQPGPG